MRLSKKIYGSAGSVRTGSLLLLLWLTVSLFAGAALAQTEELRKAASKEGQLNWYVADNSEAGAKIMAAAFMKKFPEIQVSVLRLTSGQMMARFAAEYGSGVHSSDILTIASDDLLAAKAEWFKPLSQQHLQTVSEYPKEFNKGHYLEYLALIWNVAYNTRLVKVEDAPKRWEDLVSDRWKKKVLVGDPRATPQMMSVLQALREQLGDGFLEKLGKQELVVVDSIGPGAQQLAAGVVEVGIFQAPHTQPLVEAKAPITLALMPEPYLFGPVFAALPVHAAHPNAARLFLDWLLSEGIETQCAVPYSYVALRQNYAGNACVRLPSNASDYRILKKVPDDKAAEVLRLIQLKR